ncbi:MAG TPA: hypothetical protein VFZ01_13065 [Geminicoccaceae bacterium]
MNRLMLTGLLALLATSAAALTAGSEVEDQALGLGARPVLAAPDRGPAGPAGVPRDVQAEARSRVEARPRTAGV